MNNKNLKFDKPTTQVVEVSNENKIANFKIKPLACGYGITLGNALRRVLLASMPGAAIVNIKIDGVEHEFSTIKGVVEDCMSIVLNIKQVVIQVDSLDPNFEAKLSLYKMGPGKVLAGDFAKLAGVKIVNPEQVICTLMDKHDFNLTATVRRGVGYVNADQNKVYSKGEIGIIAVDALYSPIVRVAYNVEKTRGDDDELNLEVETNGAIEAKDAVGIASKMLIDYFNEIKTISQSQLAQDNFLEEAKVVKENKLPDLNIVEVEGLKVGIINVLKKNNIAKISEIAKLSADELLAEGLEKDDIKIIKKLLKEYQLELKPNEKTSEGK